MSWYFYPFDLENKPTLLLFFVGIPIIFFFHITLQSHYLAVIILNLYFKVNTEASDLGVKGWVEFDKVKYRSRGNQSQYWKWWNKGTNSFFKKDQVRFHNQEVIPLTWAQPLKISWAWVMKAFGCQIRQPVPPNQ